MANNFKKVIDRQIWAQVAPAPNAHAAGMGLCADLRNTVERNPAVYQLSTNAILNRYNIVTKGWSLAAAPSLGGTFGAGAGCVFAQCCIDRTRRAGSKPCQTRLAKLH